MGRIKTWLRNLFEGKKARKSKVYLSKEDVERVEEHLEVYSGDTIMQYFNISESTYNKIKKGTHIYSSRANNE